MIILNTQKGLIEIESWEDIESRPGFAVDLDPKAHALEAILGRYIFRDKIRCGLSNCHTLHAKGYIVATKDGRETNIGKDCGRTYFGVDFETLSRKFDRDIAEKENREKLWSFAFRLDELKNEIAEIRGQDRGADWVYRNIRRLTEVGSGCPEEVVRRVRGMIKSRQAQLTLEREATGEEIDTLEATQGRRVQRPFYIAEPIAEIVGMEALYPENDLRELLVMNLEAKIKEFEVLDIDTLSFESLRKWAKWTDTVAATIDTATDAVVRGRKLLMRGNLEPFARILRDADDDGQFRRFLNSLS
ncbi:MAG: hypothetical protein B6D36_00310 [Planctomycetes bacterium UTPLA1]|jgi:hypothetical protein|nr:MAG: hypothetical protein B6D36_00310 [Planctomycetes bacterium UTPLA1]